jgi:hypothetical protein
MISIKSKRFPKLSSANSYRYDGLKILIIFQQCFGVHYKGSRIRPNEKKIIWKFLIIGWSFIILSSTLYTVTIFFSNYKFIDTTNSTVRAKAVIYTITTSMALSSYSLSSLIIYIVLLLIGEKLLDAVQDLNTKLDSIDESREKKIGITLTIMHFCSHICVSAFYAALNVRSFDLLTICYSLDFYLMEFIQTSIVPLIAYESLIIKNYLELLARYITPIRLALIHQKLCHIKHHIQIINSFISPIILLICFSSSTILMTSICVNINDNMYKNSYLPYIFFYSCLIFALSYVCELIPKSIEKFCNSVEYNLSVNYSIDETCIQYINLLNNMKHEICFSPFGMFRIGLKTLLSILSLVTTYVIIIIQTSGTANYN